jgi:hypothetical protein
MAIDFFTLRQVTGLIEQKLEEAKRAVPKAYTAATDASGAFAGDIARSKAESGSNPRFTDQGVITGVTAKAREESARKIHDTIHGHLKAGKGVAVFLHKEPKFGEEHEGELERHYIVPHTDGHYLVSGKKTIKIAGMAPGGHGFISIMPHSTGRKSASPVGYIPAGSGSEQHVRTFDPEQVERSGLGKGFKMKLRGAPTLD